MPATTIVPRVRQFGAMLAAALLATAGSARANLITQSLLTTGQTSQNSGFGGSFDQFDPTLGTLNTVSLNFSGDLTFFTTFALDPGGCFGSSCVGHASYSVGFNFNAPGYPLRNSFSAPFYAIVNAEAFADASNLAPQTTGPFPIQFGPLDADPSALSSYIGTGLVTVAGGISEDSDICDDLGVSCSLSDNLKLFSALTYNFTPVPEPFTLSLFGVGVASLTAMRRRMKKAA